MGARTPVPPDDLLTVRKALSLVPPGRMVLVGAGSPYRSDDGVGLRVADLVGRVLRQEPKGTVGATGMHVVGSIVAETTPESMTGTIALLHPDTVLLIAAVDMGLEPGRIAMLTAADLATRTVWEGHRPVLATVMDYVAVQTGARVLLLGIQAATTQWGAGLTPTVRHAARLVACMVLRTSGVLPREVRNGA